MNNCGACGHGCLGGACSAGACQPVVLATLAGGCGLAIGLDATRVYWSYSNNCALSAGVIMSVPLSGGSPTTLFTGPGFLDLFVSEGDIYITNSLSQGSVYGCPVAGCGSSPPYVLGTNEQGPGGIAVNSVDAYWADYGVGIKLNNRGGGGGSAEVVSDPQASGPIALDSNNVYWASYNSSTMNSGAISSTPLFQQPGSGTVHTLASALPGPNGLVVDSSFVYFTTYVPATIKKVPLAGGSATTLANLGATSSTSVVALAVDGANVYWALNSTTLQACPLPSCAGGPVTIAANRNGMAGIATDSSAIYWIENGAVVKVAK
jgi:hypothetical protein